MNRGYSLIFVPSKLDFLDYQGDDLYGCGIYEVEREVHQIVDELSKAFFAASLEERPNVPILEVPTEEVAYYIPELVVTALLTITTGTVSVGFYKLIESWIAHRNGRKLRIRLPNGFEVEASQLSQEQFLELLAQLHAIYGDTPASSPATEHLQRLGFKAANEKELWLELQDLQQAYDKKKEQIRLRK